MDPIFFLNTKKQPTIPATAESKEMKDKNVLLKSLCLNHDSLVHFTESVLS